MSKRVWALLPWLLAVGLVIGIIQAVPIEQTWTALQGLSLAEIGWLMLLNVLVLLTLNGRWWILLRGLGVRVPFFTLVMHRLAAFGISYFTPGPHFGGEPAQVLLVERHHGAARATAVAAVSLDKTLELLVNFTFLAAGIGVVLEKQLLRGVNGDGAITFALVLLTMPVGLLWLIWRGKRPFSRPLTLLLRRHWLMRHEQWQQRVIRLYHGAQESELQAWRLFRDAPDTVWLALLSSVLSWLFIMLEFGLLLFFLGILLTPVQIIALLVAARVAILMPLPAGLGTLEGSQVLVLEALGFNGAVGIGVTLIIRVRDACLGMLGLWWGARWLSFKPASITVRKEHQSTVDGVMIGTHLSQEEENF